MQRSIEEANVSGSISKGVNEVSLDAPGVIKGLAAKIKFDINGYAIKAYYEPHRWHLGASLIGHDCARYLWFTFRWCGVKVGIGKNDEERQNNLGRMLRLFNRGHREEDRYVEYLKGIGCEVWTHDEQGKQFRMSAVQGHYGGSLDAVVKLPIRYGIKEPLLAEFKTNGTGRNFEDLDEKGLAVAKPQHFTQMSAYGNEYQFRYGAYFNTNKNDDDMFIEVVKLNWNQAEQMKAKAERIILADSPPPRLAENPTYFKCQYCDFKQICHERKPVDRNCRSCINARPAAGGEWFCNVHQGTIPREFVPQGCPQYKALING